MKRATAALPLLLVLLVLLVVTAFVTGFAAFIPLMGPPVIECEADRETCETVMDHMESAVEGDGPVTYFGLDYTSATPSCGDWSLEKYRFVIGPFAFWEASGFTQPLC
jgi:hypothetical protein